MMNDFQTFSQFMTLVHEDRSEIDDGRCQDQDVHELSRELS